MGRQAHITPALLRQAHAQMLSRHPDWSGSFDEDMEHPLRMRLVRCTAVGLCFAHEKHAEFSKPRPAPAGHPRSTGFDAKRAAAGDFS